MHVEARFLLTALVITPSGSPRQELFAFLESVSILKLVNGPEAPVACPLPRADMLIFDVLAAQAVDWVVLRTLKGQLPEARCVIVVGSPQQVRRAISAGADQVLLSGFSATEFMMALAAVTQGLAPRKSGQSSAQQGGR